MGRSSSGRADHLHLPLPRHPNRLTAAASFRDARPAARAAARSSARRAEARLSSTTLANVSAQLATVLQALPAPCACLLLPKVAPSPQVAAPFARRAATVPRISSSMPRVAGAALLERRLAKGLQRALCLAASISTSRAARSRIAQVSSPPCLGLAGDQGTFLVDVFAVLKTTSSPHPFVMPLPRNPTPPPCFSRHLLPWRRFHGRGASAGWVPRVFGH
jgi:hypothetical protein